MMAVRRLKRAALLAAAGAALGAAQPAMAPPSPLPKLPTTAGAG